MSTPEKPRIIALFDVDGTLTIPRGEVTPEMMAFMKDLSKKITVGIVGGKHSYIDIGIASLSTKRVVFLY